MAPDPYLTANTFRNNNNIENGKNKIFLSKIWIHDSSDIIARLLCARSLRLTLKVASHCHPWYYSLENVTGCWFECVATFVIGKTPASFRSPPADVGRSLVHRIYTSVRRLSSACRSAWVRCSVHFFRVTECLARSIPLAPPNGL